MNAKEFLKQLYPNTELKDIVDLKTKQFSAEEMINFAEIFAETTDNLFNLATGIKLLKMGKKIRKRTWRKTFSWLEYSQPENTLLQYDFQGLDLKVYLDVDLDNPGSNNNMDEKVWEICNIGD